MKFENIEYDEFIGLDEPYLERERVRQDHYEQIYQYIMFGCQKKPVTEFQGFPKPV